MDQDKAFLEPLDLGSPRSQASPVGRIAVFAVFACLVFAGWKFFGPRNALAEEGWIGDWNTAIEQARSSGKPALVLFTADWCPACKQFESEALTDPNVKQYLKDNLTLVVVDLTDRMGPNAQRAQEFKVHAIPTLILFDRNGEEKARDFGMPAGPLLRWLGANMQR